MYNLTFDWAKTVKKARDWYRSCQETNKKGTAVTIIYHKKVLIYPAERTTSLLYFVQFPTDGIGSHLSERTFYSKANVKKISRLPILFVKTLSFQADELFLCGGMSGE